MKKRRDYNDNDNNNDDDNDDNGGNENNGKELWRGGGRNPKMSWSSSKDSTQLQGGVINQNQKF